MYETVLLKDATNDDIHQWLEAHFKDYVFCGDDTEVICTAFGGSLFAQAGIVRHLQMYVDVHLRNSMALPMPPSPSDDHDDPGASIGEPGTWDTDYAQA